eukprot:comp22508_c1_seq2/m.56268 comp22508_c1_seq2/g.56268  ORF comp22508_c1_seq2/g.56268 comp22508_c1_seq2/m.56268 type:complete len:758 (-) comp22508_c1_seq2:2764-5037(-)
MVQTSVSSIVLDAAVCALFEQEARDGDFARCTGENERGASFGIADIDVRVCIDEHACAFEGAAHGREMQGGFAGIVADVDICAARDEHLCNLGRAQIHGMMERGPSLLVLRVDLCAIVEQRCDFAQIAANHGRVQVANQRGALGLAEHKRQLVRGLARVVCNVGLGAGLEQHLDDVLSADAHGHMQAGVARGVLEVGVCTVLDEQLDHGDVLQLNRKMERGVAVLVAHVLVDAVVEQICGEFNVVVLDSNMERGESLGIEGIDSNAGLEHHFELLFVAAGKAAMQVTQHICGILVTVENRKHERGVAVGIDTRRIGTVSKEHAAGLGVAVARGNMERCGLGAVDNVGVDTRALKESNERLDVARAGGKMHGALAVLVGGMRICAGPDERGGDLPEAQPRGDVERGLAVVVALGEIGAVADLHLDDLEIPRCRGAMDGAEHDCALNVAVLDREIVCGAAVGVLDVRHNVVLEKMLEHMDLPADGGMVEGIVARGVRGLDIESCALQGLEDINSEAALGAKEPCGAVELVDGLDVGLGVHEGDCGLACAVQACDEEWGELFPVGDLDFGAFAQQILDHFGLVSAGRIVERGAAVGIEGVDESVGAVLDDFHNVCKNAARGGEMQVGEDLVELGGERGLLRELERGDAALVGLVLGAAVLDEDCSCLDLLAVDGMVERGATIGVGLVGVAHAFKEGAHGVDVALFAHADRRGVLALGGVWKIRVCAVLDEARDSLFAVNVAGDVDGSNTELRVDGVDVLA